MTTTSPLRYTVTESHRYRISTIEFWDNGIVYFNLDDNAQVELEDTIKKFNLLKSKFNGEHKHLILVESGFNTSISKEAREYSTRPTTNELTKATAVIVKSLAHRIIINFIINMTNQQTMKMRMFDKRENAIEWLLSFKD